MAEIHEAPSLASIDKKVAVLCERIEHIKATTDSTSRQLEEHVKEGNRQYQETKHCLDVLETNNTDQEEEIGILRKKMDGVEAKSNVWDGINTILTIVAGILGLRKI